MYNYVNTPLVVTFWGYHFRWARSLSI